MRAKNIIKRGTKDTKWLDKFVESRLSDKAIHKASCTDKMYNAISNYARCLDYHISETCVERGLFFNNGEYALEVIKGYKNKNILYIYNIEKCIELEIQKRIEDYEETNRRYNETPTEEELQVYLQFFKKDTTENFNPFSVNFTKETANKIMNERKQFLDIIKEYL